jgi:hypothetical protein
VRLDELVLGAERGDYVGAAAVGPLLSVITRSRAGMPWAAK